MNTNTPKNRTIYDRLAMFSLIAGAFGLLSCCFGPPIQLVCGGAAIILALGSKDGRSLSSAAKTGLILGIVSAATAVFLFIQYVWALNLIQDPANADLVKELYRQTQELMDQIMTTQPAQ